MVIAYERENVYYCELDRCVYVFVHYKKIVVKGYTWYCVAVLGALVGCTFPIKCQTNILHCLPFIPT